MDKEISRRDFLGIFIGAAVGSIVINKADSIARTYNTLVNGAPLLPPVKSPTENNSLPVENGEAPHEDLRSEQQKIYDAFNAQFTMVEGDTQPFLLPPEIIDQYLAEQQVATLRDDSIFLRADKPLPTAEQINEFLDAVGSPAAGTGHIWLEMAKRYNIDVFFKEAKYLNESTGGRLGAAVDTHAIGNIRWVPPEDNYWAEGFKIDFRDSNNDGIEDKDTTALREKYGGRYSYFPLRYTKYSAGWNGFFMSYADDSIGWRTSIEADFRLIRYYIDIMKKEPIVSGVIPTWAPSEDKNDPSAYGGFLVDYMHHAYSGQLEQFLKNRKFASQDYVFKHPYDPNS